MKTLIENRFDNVKATIINNIKKIYLDLIDKNRKKIYKKILGSKNHAKRDLDILIIEKLNLDILF